VRDGSVKIGLRVCLKLSDGNFHISPRNGGRVHLMSRRDCKKWEKFRWSKMVRLMGTDLMHLAVLGLCLHG